MKTWQLFIVLWINGFVLLGQQINFPLEKDVKSIDGIIKAYYEVVSGPKGAPRQWERDRSLHHESAYIVFTGKKNGKSYAKPMSLKDFHKMEDPYTNGFFETEVKREIREFGNIAHVWSYYETRHSEDGEVVGAGTNSIQLYHDGNRWWIMSWIFDSLRDDNRHQYLE
ncbi:hypothetical protein [Ekhidna sp.]|jgi:hypothetical protein|uniref:hypothetical protein n=1 Tax=Ekhidna sp. TaxID=2608089 RepID=UPI0032F07514